MILDNEEKKQAFTALNALVRKYPEKFDENKMAAVNELRKQYVKEVMFPYIGKYTPFSEVERLERLQKQKEAFKEPKSTIEVIAEKLTEDVELPLGLGTIKLKEDAPLIGAAGFVANLFKSGYHILPALSPMGKHGEKLKSTITERFERDITPFEALPSLAGRKGEKLDVVKKGQKIQELTANILIDPWFLPVGRAVRKTMQVLSLAKKAITPKSVVTTLAKIEPKVKISEDAIRDLLQHRTIIPEGKAPLMLEGGATRLEAEGILEGQRKLVDIKIPKGESKLKVTKQKLQKVEEAKDALQKGLSKTQKTEEIAIPKHPKVIEKKADDALAKSREALSGKEFSEKGLRAIGKDIKGDIGIVADPHKNLRQFLKENKLKLTDEEIAKIHQFGKKLSSEISRNTKRAELFENYISKNFPQLKIEPIIEIPTKPLGKVDLKKISGSKYLNIRSEVQDAQIHIRKLQETSDVVKDVAGKNRYDAEVLYHGRIASRLEKVQESISAIDKDVLKTAKAIGKDDKDLLKKVYTYLIARHTPERNLALGVERSTGVSTVEAEKLLSQIEKLPEINEVKRIANEISKLNKQTLDVLKEGQVIDDGLYNLLRKKYKYHVPLQRILEGTEDIGQVLNSGKGFMVRSTGLKRAKGSELEIADLLKNVSANVTQATIRAEKNLVNLATLKFARENPSLGLFREIKPKIIGVGKGKRPLYERIDTSPQSNILAMREKGKPVYLEISDPVFAEAFKAIGVENVPRWMKYVNSFSRFISGLATRFNPEFPIPNIMRDTQEMAAFLASQKGFGLRKTAQAISKEPSSIKDVASALWGKGDTPGAKLYKQMVADGGTTGGMALSTKKQLEVNLQAIRKLNRSKPRQAANNVLKYVDDLNAVFEDATRLSAYKQALKSGFTREQAAVIAKESTINFNRKGKLTPIINALWIFSNASIQGSVKMLKAMRNPKVATAVLGAIGSATWAVNKWNDSIDPQWRDKVSDWDRMNGLPIVIQTDEGIDYVTIPVSWGVKPYKVLFDTMWDSMQGIDIGSLQKIVSKISSSILDAYNPIGGSTFGQALAPTFIDLPYDLAMNQAWHGGDLKPKEVKGLPESMRYFDSLPKTQTGKTAVDITKILHDNIGLEISPTDMIYAIEHYVGGTGRFLSRTLNTVVAIGKGEEPEVRSIPVINRFYKSVDEERLKKSAQFKEIKKDYFQDLVSENAIAQANRRRKANDTVEKFETITDISQRRRIVKDLYNSDPRTYETFKRFFKYKLKGLDYIERQVIELSPPIRAKWVFDELTKTDKPKIKFFELKRKKIITTDTLKELVKLGYKIK